MRRTFLLLFVSYTSAASLAGCGEGGGTCDAALITVNPNTTTDAAGEHVLVSTPCYGTDDAGARDYSACCPDGYAYLAVSGDGSILCEEECGGST